MDLSEPLFWLFVLLSYLTNNSFLNKLTFSKTLFFRSLNFEQGSF